MAKDKKAEKTESKPAEETLRELKVELDAGKVPAVDVVDVAPEPPIAPIDPSGLLVGSPTASPFDTPEDLLAEIRSAVETMEKTDPPEHLSREDIHDRLLAMVTEMEREVATVAADAPSAILDAFAGLLTRMRRRASDFGPAPALGQRFRVVAPCRYVLNGSIHQLARDSIVSKDTHDLASLLAGGARLEPIVEPS